jgi:hypothetical protein
MKLGILPDTVDDANIEKFVLGINRIRNADSENQRSKPSGTGREILRGGEVLHGVLRRAFRSPRLVRHE